jgi:cell division GTPase FtsZ
MEYLEENDYNQIKEIIDEFVGDTILGNHLFKAIKIYFKQKSKLVVPAATKKETFEKQYKFNELSISSNIKKLEKDADEALLNYNKKLRKQINGFTKSKKKTN